MCKRQFRPYIEKGRIVASFSFAISLTLILLLFLILSTCSGTVSVSTNWSSSNEPTFRVVVTNDLSQPVIVNVNGTIFPELAAGETSKTVEVHIFDIPGIYLAVTFPNPPATQAATFTEAQTGVKQRAGAVYDISIDSFQNDTLGYTITEGSTP